METDVEMTWEAKHERAMARVNRLAVEARTLLRTVGPRISAAQDRQDEVSIKHCSFCNPPPHMYSCPLCGFASEAKWRMSLHVDLRPKWCTDRAAKKAREWAKKS